MQYDATVNGSRVRVTNRKTGSTKIVFDVSGEPTHAIASGDSVSVYFPGGGVRVYSLGGSLLSFSGDMSSKPKARKRNVDAVEEKQPVSRRPKEVFEASDDLRQSLGVDGLKKVEGILSKIIVLALLIIAIVVAVPYACRAIFR